MRHLVFSVGTWLCLSVGSWASAPKVYEGNEAAALRCANAMAFTAVALAETGAMGEPEKNVMLQISVLILDRHVSGSWAQKKAALEIVRDRRDVDQTLDDFQRYAEQCLRQFPIN